MEAPGAPGVLGVEALGRLRVGESKPRICLPDRDTWFEAGCDGARVAPILPLEVVLKGNPHLWTQLELLGVELGSDDTDNQVRHTTKGNGSANG